LGRSALFLLGIAMLLSSGKPTSILSHTFSQDREESQDLFDAFLLLLPGQLKAADLQVLHYGQVGEHATSSAWCSASRTQNLEK